jgi:hypothetical protein
LRAARTALRRAVRAAPVFRSSWGPRSALIEAMRLREQGERPVPFGDQIQEPGRLGRLPRMRRGRGRRPGATGHSARTRARNPVRVEAGGQGQAEQPQEQAAEDGERGGRSGRPGRPGRRPGSTARSPGWSASTPTRGARATGGEPTRSEESSEVRWIPRVELGGYSMDRSMRLRIGHYLEGRATPYLG